MDLRLPASASATNLHPRARSYAFMSSVSWRNVQGGYIAAVKRSNRHARRASDLRCRASKGRGFGAGPPKEEEKNNDAKTMKENKRVASKSRSVSGEPNSRSQQAPGVSNSVNRSPNNALFDHEFLEKVEAVRRSAIKQKKVEGDRIIQAIDYDAPIESTQSTVGLGTKVGVGVAVVVFGLVFALGDFLPSGSVGPNDDASLVERSLTEEEKTTFQSALQQYEATLSKSPQDPSALEGAAVTLVELGKYERASSLLEKLIKERPDYTDAYRLLGEVKYKLKDFDGSASAYRTSLSASDNIDFEVLRGLTSSLLANKKPDEAVKVLLDSRQHLTVGNVNQPDVSIGSRDEKIQQVDLIQVDLLLGKAYSDWGHVSDAITVYDQLISRHPDDFRGYLAKGIILKENGKVGDAERMFIQARFFAPEKAKVLVDRYARK